MKVDEFKRLRSTINQSNAQHSREVKKRVQAKMVWTCAEGINRC